MSTVTVISCSHHAWVSSSITMGNFLANHTNKECNIVCPQGKEGFYEAWKNLGEIVIIHTHGSSEAIFNQINGTTPLVASIQDIKDMQPNPSVKLAIATSCSLAGGNESGNIAAEISKKINSNGVVIANKYIVWGADYDFWSEDNKNGWLMYRNGTVIKRENQLPQRLSMIDAYNEYLKV